MKEFLILQVVLLYCMLFSLAIKNHNLKQYDYHIELEQEYIEILDQHGVKSIIHCDSLQQFIEQDNL